MDMTLSDKPFEIAGKAYSSRLLVGTGKYRDFDQTRAAIEASGAQIVTVAIRRTNMAGRERTLAARLPPAIEVHPLAQYRRLLQRGRRGAHPAPGARTSRRPYPGQA